MEVGSNLSDKGKYDLQLVHKAIAGDQSAYAELLSRYRDPIYFMLLKMVNNKSDADDLTIEAFGKAFKSIQQYTPNYAFSTWLFKIATNNCIDFIRKKRETHISIDQPSEDGEGGQSVPASNLLSGVLDPEENLIKEQNIQLVKELVEKLKPRYRKLIELRYFQEYSYVEIADELNIPLGTVKAQLFRARELLYNILVNNSQES